MTEELGGCVFGRKVGVHLFARWSSVRCANLN
jgi:hypothetical protein